MDIKKKASFVSAILFFAIIIVINYLWPYMKKRQDTIDIFILAIISSTVYYFIAYFLLRFIERRKNKKEKQ